MGEFQVNATEQKLNHRPESSPSANPRSGEFQIETTQMKLNHTPISSPSANPKSGEFQIHATEMPLNRTPQKGWGSAANLPMSERAEAASRTSGKKK